MKFCVATAPHWRFPEMASLLKIIQRADELGFYSIQLPEHLMMPYSHSGGLRPLHYNTIVLGSAIAAMTHRVRIFFNVFILPYHHPLRLAQEIASLDILSQGRVIVGVGVGWLEAEFKALGLPFKERGAMTDEGIQALKVLWTAKAPSFQGKYYNFKDIAFEPKPVQKPHPPIWVGGAVHRSLERAAAFGDGWSPMRKPWEGLKQEAVEMRRLLTERGRAKEDFTFSYIVDYGSSVESIAPYARLAGSSEPTVLSAEPEKAFALIRELEGMGFTHLMVHFTGTEPRTFQEEMERFHHEIMLPLSRQGAAQ